RRVARVVDAPFLKVEATKFTEVGYVGRDVESIVRDLVEVSIGRLHDEKLAQVQPEAERAATERLAAYLLRQREAARPRQRAAPRPRRAGRAALVAVEVGEVGEPGRDASARRLQRQRRRLVAQLEERQLE